LCKAIEAFVEQLDLREIATSTRWEALPRFAEAYGEGNADTARALAQWGKLRHKRHEYADAKRLLRCALVIRVSKPPDDHPLTVTTRRNLGRVLRR
jgi:Tetratricopeptide repeat